MTIDDELILELIKPNRFGEVGEGALIIKVVGTKKVDYDLEQTTYHWREWFDKDGQKRESKMIPMTPDIMAKVVSIEGGKRQIVTIAIELENDLQWDFGESLRQLRKYKLNFKDTRIIIPNDYERFAPLYKKAGFRVYLWKAKRRWQCLKCGTETTKEGPVIPKCSNAKCGNHSQNEFRLVGLKDAVLEEF
jgi:hypothetical protein